MWVLKVKVISWPWAQGRVHTKIQTRFSQKLLCRSEPYFVWKLSGTRKWKSDDMMLVTWPRWPPRAYIIKTFENLLLQNLMSYDLETWLVASGTQALQSLFKWWPWRDLDLFYGKVKFGNIGFSMGKVKTVDFSETIAASDLKVSRSSHLIEYMKVSEYWRSRSFLDLGPRSSTYKN